MCTFGMCGTEHLWQEGEDPHPGSHLSIIYFSLEQNLGGVNDSLFQFNWNKEDCQDS